MGKEDLVTNLFSLAVSPRLHPEIFASIEANPGIVEESLAVENPQDGISLFGIFVGGGNVKLVSHILDRYRIDIEHKDDRGRTPLMHCCRLGQAPMAMLLLDRGAEPETVDADGNAALFHAVLEIRRGELDLVPVVERLIQMGADPERKDRSGTTPLEVGLSRQVDSLTAALTGESSN